MNDKIKYFFPKVLNRLASEKNLIWEHLPVEKISLWGMGRVPSKEEFAKRLQEMLGEFTPDFFAGIDSQDKETIISCADNALNHDFDILGSGLMHLDPIPWHSDFKSGHIWGKGQFYQDYNVDLDTTRVDGKTPWELNRCQHLLWLGEAYRITGKTEYAKEIIDEIYNWIDENPLMHSVNWTCAMDVAFRAVNWMYSIWLIQDAAILEEKFISRFQRSLFQHAFCIRNNLEKVVPYSNNHYASDIVGLLYLGSLFDRCLKGRLWFKFAKKEYFKEVELQILDSGAHYERSISYHRMMTEMYSAAYYLLQRRCEKVPDVVCEKLGKMYRFVADYTKPNGLAPQIEDNDDGRFLPFVRRDFRNHSYLLDELSVEQTLMRCGQKVINIPEITGNYGDCGHWIQRSGDAYLFVTNGGQSRMPSPQIRVSTHTHNDLLSFELALGQDDLIVDPGTYQYLFSKPEGRNEFRSTKKHNTIMVDGEEQHFLSGSHLFVIDKNAVIDSDDSYHTSSGLTHKREFTLRDTELVIRDTVSKQGDNHQLVCRFHFAPDVKLTASDLSVDFETEHFYGQLQFRTLSIPKMELVDDTVSSSYGTLQESKTVELSLAFNEQTIVDTYISWKNK